MSTREKVAEIRERIHQIQTFHPRYNSMPVEWSDMYLADIKTLLSLLTEQEPVAEIIHFEGEDHLCWYGSGERTLHDKAGEPPALYLAPQQDRDREAMNRLRQEGYSWMVEWDPETCLPDTLVRMKDSDTFGAYFKDPADAILAKEEEGDV